MRIEFLFFVGVMVFVILSLRFLHRINRQDQDKED